MLARRLSVARCFSTSTRPRISATLTTKSTSCYSDGVKNTQTRWIETLTMESMNARVVEAEYAVRGAVAVRAEQLRQQLADKTPGVPFEAVISCNIGNPQQLGQQPITFFRQVSALVEYPELLKDTHTFPEDARKRAATILASCGGNIGAYSHSMGIPSIRKNVAKFIEERDGGVKADPEQIFLTAGASQGVQFLLQCIIQNEQTGIMIPIPQYPLYTATLALYHGRPVEYFLDEKSGWSLSISELERSVKQARAKGTDVRALCVINPGNPTGNCLSLENMRDIVKFCETHRLVLLADEVYQANVYTKDKPFHSFKKVASSMKSRVELVSFHSVSKGMIGECGRRGGYFECTHIDAQVRDQIYKLASISLCPAVQGQIMVDLMVQPPKQGDPSYPLYKKEMDGIYESLKRRAAKLSSAFNQLEGVSCQEAEGSMYLFPRITIPPKAVTIANERKQHPDLFYVMELLNATGVCMVPGSGFGQEPGTFHFRSTFLPPEEQFDPFIQRISKFHASFMDKYRE